jgi:hypothetical protein
MGPVPLALKPLMFVIEIISHLARPLSLTLRLFGNMFGGHILLAIIFFLMGLQGSSAGRCPGKRARRRRGRHRRGRDDRVHGRVLCTR